MRKEKNLFFSINTMPEHYGPFGDVAVHEWTVDGLTANANRTYAVNGSEKSVFYHFSNLAFITFFVLKLEHRKSRKCRVGSKCKSTEIESKVREKKCFSVNAKKIKLRLRERDMRRIGNRPRSDRLNEIWKKKEKAYIKNTWSAY